MTGSPAGMIHGLCSYSPCIIISTAGREEEEDIIRVESTSHVNPPPIDAYIYTQTATPRENSVLHHLCFSMRNILI